MHTCRLDQCKVLLQGRSEVFGDDYIGQVAKSRIDFRMTAQEYEFSRVMSCAVCKKGEPRRIVGIAHRVCGVPAQLNCNGRAMARMPYNECLCPCGCGGTRLQGWQRAVSTEVIRKQLIEAVVVQILACRVLNDAGPYVILQTVVSYI